MSLMSSTPFVKSNERPAFLRPFSNGLSEFITLRPNALSPSDLTTVDLPDPKKHLQGKLL